LKVKVKGQGHQGQKRHFSALSAACMRFMFCKTSLASSSHFYSRHVFYVFNVFFNFLERFILKTLEDGTQIVRNNKLK